MHHYFQWGRPILQKIAVNETFPENQYLPAFGHQGYLRSDLSVLEFSLLGVV